VECIAFTPNVFGIPAQMTITTLSAHATLKSMLPLNAERNGYKNRWLSMPRIFADHADLLALLLFLGWRNGRFRTGR
jgi:hypothetical protein